MWNILRAMAKEVLEQTLMQKTLAQYHPTHKPTRLYEISPEEANMKSSSDIIQWLNRQLQHELTAINQYFLHARMYENWGLNSLNKHEYEESIEEMKHADALIRRILFLEGLPNLQELGKLLIGEKAEECVACDLKLEILSRETLLAAIAASETAKDYVSRELFKEILEDTEEHIDWLEIQLDVMQKVGIQNWLQSQM